MGRFVLRLLDEIMRFAFLSSVFFTVDSFASIRAFAGRLFKRSNKLPGSPCSGTLIRKSASRQGSLQTSRTGLLRPSRHHVDKRRQFFDTATAKGEEQTDSIPTSIE
jgi:hypothetical protein